HKLDSAGAGPPPLGGINSRFSATQFATLVHSGRGEMPAFGDLDDTATKALFDYLSTSAGPRRSTAPAVQSVPGPVVASGGAPGGRVPRPGNGPRYTPLGGPPYPAGVSAPAVRYYTDWGLFPDKPWVISPPWSSLVAYDLNKGTIKWKVPLGQDPMAAAQGAKNTGAFDAQHHGIIVTATGLIFVAASDGKLQAFDENTGKVLWTKTLPASSEGIPSMYEVNGRQYLVVPASSTTNPGGGHLAPGEKKVVPAVNRSYVVFALPRKK
ncbi:MAG: PQQ-binding-like beta-propeller repeat protein, partial [Terriglobia bacterium]